MINDVCSPGKRSVFAAVACAAVLSIDVGAQSTRVTLGARTKPVNIIANGPAAAGPGTVLYHRKISATEGGVIGDIEGDSIGTSVATIGDLDGDGVLDLAVGAPGDDDIQPDEGSVWILFMKEDGTVKAQQKISSVDGGFGGSLTYSNRFGAAVAPLGDLDGDGTLDIAVGADFGSDGSVDEGDVWILFLNPDGTVKAEQHITENVGGFNENLTFTDFFGKSVDCLGDLDGDGVVDLAVGAPGVRQGSVWILFLNTDGTVKAYQEITQGVGGFIGNVSTGQRFGWSLCSIGDLDGDCVVDLAVGALADGGRGAVWILFMNPDGTVRFQRKINDKLGQFKGSLDVNDSFGRAVTPIHRLDGDRTVELAVGASGDDDGGNNRGAVWVLFLNSNGTVAGHQKISDTQGGFTGTLFDFHGLGKSLTTMGDADGDGVADLIVGTPDDDDGPGSNGGALWELYLDGLVALDFENEDDHWTPLANGQDLNTPDEFSRLVTIDGAGYGNYGAAIFDSKPTGPNEFSSDPDLLVDLGNVLILQEQQPQTVPGIFDDPDDAQLGGTLAFSFDRFVELHAIDLIDICPGPPTQTAVVTMIDGLGRQRTYTVPDGWTTDLLVLGGPGYGTLDLTSLAPQLGYVSTATSVEDSGFEATSVVRLEVTLSSSGAVNDLVLDPHP